jgi:NADH dehydrogenase
MNLLRVQAIQKLSNQENDPALANSYLASTPRIADISKQPVRSQAMRARIYQPGKTAMSSGSAKTKQWVLEFAPASARSVDPLMGWTSSSDTQSQVRLTFESLNAAQDYAREHGIDALVQQPNKRKPNIRAGGYGENFATGRRGAWTH